MGLKDYLSTPSNSIIEINYAKNFKTMYLTRKSMDFSHLSIHMGKIRNVQAF